RRRLTLAAPWLERVFQLRLSPDLRERRRRRQLFAAERQVVTKSQPLHQLHRQVWVTSVDAGVEDLHHVGMRQLGQRLEFAREPARGAWIQGGPGGEQLQGDGLSAASIHRAIDGSCTAGADGLEDPIWPNHPRWHEVGDPRKLALPWSNT